MTHDTLYTIEKCGILSSMQTFRRAFNKYMDEGVLIIKEKVNLHASFPP